MDTSKVAEKPLESFVILTPRLIVLPTPHAISLISYRRLYASLHANKDFCEMAFGVHFPPRQWSDDETRDVIQTRDITRCWKVRGMGDFAVGLRPPDISMGSSKNIEILKGDDFEGNSRLNIHNLSDTIWVGYAGVRDGTTTSIPPREADDPPLPPWNEMVEVRYGVSPMHWGNGIAKEAAEAVMHWAVKARGVTRFIAETERPNKRSARALEKLGFTLSGTNYWKEPSELEWERIQ
jgi:RimJ/RimL family protein N-acetyltransferase